MKDKAMKFEFRHALVTMAAKLLWCNPKDMRVALYIRRHRLGRCRLKVELLSNSHRIICFALNVGPQILQVGRQIKAWPIFYLVVLHLFKGQHLHLNKGPTSTFSWASTCKACIYRKGLRDEQKESCHLWYGSYWYSLFKFKVILCTVWFGVTHSFISTQSISQLDLEHVKVETNFRIKLLNDSKVYCPIFNKYVLISTSGSIFFRDLIRFGRSDFDIILGMNWLHTYGAKIDCKDLKATLNDDKGWEVCFYGQREEKPCSLTVAMKASKLLC